MKGNKRKKDRRGERKGEKRKNTISGKGSKVE